MNNKFMSCTIKRKGEKAVVLTFSSESGDVIRILQTYFEEYLTEGNYGICLADSREELLREQYVFTSGEKSYNTITCNCNVYIYKKDKCLCKLIVPSTADYLIIKKAIELCGKKYSVTK